MDLRFSHFIHGKSRPRKFSNSSRIFTNRSSTLWFISSTYNFAWVCWPNQPYRNELDISCVLTILLMPISLSANRVSLFLLSRRCFWARTGTRIWGLIQGSTDRPVSTVKVALKRYDSLKDRQFYLGTSDLGIRMNYILSLYMDIKGKLWKIEGVTH